MNVQPELITVTNFVTIQKAVTTVLVIQDTNWMATLTVEVNILGFKLFVMDKCRDNVIIKS